MSNKRHKWRQGGKGWYECVNCGLIKEKHFGFPWTYYYETLTGQTKYMDKAPPCKVEHDFTDKNNN